MKSEGNRIPVRVEVIAIVVERIVMTDKYLDLARELKKLWNIKVTIVPIVIGALGTLTKGSLKGPGGFGSWRKGRDYPNDSIAEDGQNTETNPGDLRRLAVTETPVKDHQLILMWKTLEE